MKLGKAQRNKKQEQRTTYKKEQRTKNKEHIIALRTMIEKNKARSFFSFLLCYFSFLFFAKKGMEPW